MNRQRQIIINRIIATFQKANKMEVILDEERFISEICNEYGCTRRTAREYLMTARAKLENLTSYLA